MYTVTTKQLGGTETISRFFDTKRAAQTWVKWLSTQLHINEIFLYRGQAGGELIDRKWLAPVVIGGR